MQETTNIPTHHHTPVLLNNAPLKLDDTCCDALENSTDNTGFLKQVIEIAEASGCKFLFEIPGSMFDLPDYRAAAVIHKDTHKLAHTVFILCNRETGIVRIMNDTEVEAPLLDFVKSYTGVLTSLTQLESFKYSN